MIGIGLSVAQGAVGFASANAQYEQRMREVEQNAINASNATANQYRNINIRAMQEDKAANQQRLETNIEAAKAGSAARVAAYEGGVSGLAVDHVLRDLYAQQGRHDAALDTNIRMNRDYLQGEKVAAEAGGQNQINSIPLPEKPSFAPFLINAFSSGLNTLSNSRQRRF